MKKFISLVAAIAVASTMFTSCGDKDKGTPADAKAKLTLSAAPLAVAVGAEGEFTVTSNIEAPEAITVTVKSSAEATLTVDPASVIIAKGTKTATGKFKGVAEGRANITITASGVTVSVPSVEITVGNPPAPNENIVKMVTGKSEKGEYWYAYHEDPTDPNPEGSRANLAYFDFFPYDNNEGITMNFYSEQTKEMPMGMGTLKQQGDEVGKDGIFLTPVAEGTAITFDAMATSPWGYWEEIYTPDHKVLATGNDVYVVVACGSAVEGGTSAAYRAWVKIKLGTDGSWDSFEVIESYVCMNDGEFKVGQKN